MNNNVLKKYMLISFSDDELLDYLGEDIVKSLIEWQMGNEILFSGRKKQLIELIISIYGLTILKDKEFRRKLLREFETEKINKLKEKLPKKYQEEKDFEKLKIIISNQPWKKSRIN